jgi:hypothetical protein
VAATEAPNKAAALKAAELPIKLRSIMVKKAPRSSTVLTRHKWQN